MKKAWRAWCKFCFYLYTCGFGAVFLLAVFIPPPDNRSPANLWLIAAILLVNGFFFIPALLHAQNKERST